MPWFWRTLFRGLILLWAGCLALAQPGVAPCWLEARACELHPHANPHSAEAPHSHHYLQDLAGLNAPQGLPNLWAPVSLLIEILFLSLLFRNLIRPGVVKQPWVSSPAHPPPRAAFYS